MTLRRRGYLVESLGKIRIADLGMDVDVDEDRTQKRIDEILNSSRRYVSTDYRGLTKALAAKKMGSMGKAEQEMLAVVKRKEPIDMGAYSNMLIFGPFFKYMKKTKHAAVLRLLKRGKLKIVAVRDPDERMGKESIGTTGRREFLVTA